MTSNIDKTAATAQPTLADTWCLNALTAALGDLALTVSDSLSVGRGSDNDVVLGSKEVSRNHAVLSVLNGKLYVKDLDSSNGTFINEQRIDSNKSKHLEANDTLGFASFAFTVTPLNAVDEAVEQPVVAEELIAEHKPAVDASTVDSSGVGSDNVTAETISSDVSPSPIVAENTAPTADADKPEITIDAPDVNPEPTAEAEPVVKETMVTDVLSAANGSDSNVMQEADINETKISEVNETDAPFVKETVTEETVVEEVLAAKDTVDTAPVQAAPVAPSDEPAPITEQEHVVPKEGMPKKTLIETPIAEKPLAPETPLAAEKPLAEQPIAKHQPLDNAEHDKTTKTELQEEADPDVLRAKQAATAQFSGTANLGQAHDLGTQGNNAMDQAIDNPANAGHVEKKPSGSWFIWVFAVVLIIGLALWLFNMGGV